jgi:hypothetical protein
MSRRTRQDGRQVAGSKHMYLRNYNVATTHREHLKWATHTHLFSSRNPRRRRLLPSGALALNATTGGRVALWRRWPLVSVAAVFQIDDILLNSRRRRQQQRLRRPACPSDKVRPGPIGTTTSELILSLFRRLNSSDVESCELLVCISQSFWLPGRPAGRPNERTTGQPSAR